MPICTEPPRVSECHDLYCILRYYARLHARTYTRTRFSAMHVSGRVCMRARVRERYIYSDREREREREDRVYFPPPPLSSLVRPRFRVSVIRHPRFLVTAAKEIDRVRSDPPKRPPRSRVFPDSRERTTRRPRSRVHGGARSARSELQPLSGCPYALGNDKDCVCN